MNRGHNNIANTIAAAKVAKAKMHNLLAIELGNEPECKQNLPIRGFLIRNISYTDKILDYPGAGQPVATQYPTWNPAIDAQNQDDWDIRVGQALNMHNIIQAGNSNSDPPTWGAQELIATENDTVRSYVKDYAHHNYPGGTVTSLMSHAGIVNNMKKFGPDVAAANSVGKEYVYGETNSGKQSIATKLDVVIDNIHSLRRWCCSSQPHVWRRVMDNGLLSPCSLHEYRADILPSRHPRRLSILLVGPLLHG